MGHERDHTCESCGEYSATMGHKPRCAVPRAEKAAALVFEVLELVDDSRKLFHDSTVWEDESYVGDYDIARRWASVRERAYSPDHEPPSNGPSGEGL